MMVTGILLMPSFRDNVLFSCCSRLAENERVQPREADSSLLATSRKMIYNFWIYNRSGICIYYEEWGRTVQPDNLEEEHKLMYGLIWSLKSFTLKASPFP